MIGGVFFLLLVILFGNGSGTPLSLNLGSKAWRLRSISGGRNITVQATVPGGVYSDLENAGLIQDLYYRFNDIELRWVGETDWAYSANFDLEDFPDGLLSYANVKLDFQGLDTVSEVLLNGILVGTSTNMFRRYIFDVKQALEPGMNEVEVRFVSPVRYAQAEFEKQAEDHVVPPQCVPPEFKGVCHANHIRKMQASFSWDWGPAAPSSGIWKPVHLLAFNLVRIKYLTWEVSRIGSTFIVDITTVLDAGGLESLDCVVAVEVHGVPAALEEPAHLSRNENGEMEWSTSLQLPTDKVEFWWPNGRGEQVLYDVKLDVSLPTGERIDQVVYEKSLGFRTIELVQEPSEIAGTSFYFKINGEAIFMKGSNWIPAHVLPERVTEDYTAELLYSVKEANMNMLRVWGGGIYESDQFYRLADQLGILIWQDFMFACSMYPANSHFLDNVREEVKHQVRRLSIHPSIALWAGNNENEVALRGNWYGTDTNFTVYKEDYIRLYVETVEDEVKKLVKHTPFLLSSPSNGIVNQTEGYIAKNPYSLLQGDVHVYNYRDNNWDPSIYGVPRFSSEYGFQAFPSFEIMETVSQAEDWWFGSDWFNHRQHHPGGNLELPWQINLNLYLDLGGLQTETGMQEFLYLAQVYQAESLRVESEHYRRHRSSINEKGEGMTMGALYWQLNDIWPGASWTSLEFGGKWKMSHYFAEKFFADILISPVVETEVMNVYLVCDTANQRAMSLDIRVVDWNLNMKDRTTINIKEACSTEGATILYSEPLSDILERANCRPGTLDITRFGYCALIFELYEEETGVVLSTNHLFNSPRSLVAPGSDVGSGLEKASVRVNRIQSTNQVHTGPYVESYEVEVVSDKPALFVWVEAVGIKGRFNDNGFHMFALERSLLFYAKEYTSVEELELAIQVRCYKPY